MSFLDSLQAHLDQSGLIPAGSRVLVGYSGGPDSTCLLHALKSLGFDVVAAHLHHGQRAEADDERDRCQAFAETLGVDFVAGAADVPYIAHTMKMTLEEAGRHARYDFFHRAILHSECNLIATAHTADDHAETILLNATRGSGMSGLAGIPAQAGRIIRPLLPFRRSDTVEYCAANSLWTHDDPANIDLKHSRARVRHKVMPELEQINPATVKCLARMAAIVREEDQYLNSMAAALLEQSEERLNGDLHFLTKDCEVMLSLERLQGGPPVLVGRGLRLIASYLGANLDFDQTSTLLGMVATSKAGSVTCEGGAVVFEVDASHLHARELTPVEPYQYPLTMPGETVSDEFGWQFLVHPVAVPSDPRRVSSLEAVLDQRKLRGNLFFRSQRPKDTIVPLGMDGSKPISQVLSDAKLTAAARSRLPIVYDMIGPIWVPGICIAERVRIDSTTELAIRLEFAPISGLNEP